jgi:drug/metabolite transporter (DMT)-like permease
MGSEDAMASRWAADGRTWIPWAVLAVGLISVSASAVLIRFARDAHPLAIAFWRCAGAVIVLGPFAGRGLRRIDRGGWGVSLTAGLFLAVHFATWITSLELTTVAASVLLVSTTPIFVGAASWLVFKEKLSSTAWIGILLTFVGAAIIGGGDLSGSSFIGDLLALIGGATAAGYVLAGRSARRKLGNVEYSFITYAVAGAAILGLCLIVGTPLWGYRAPTWAALVAIIIGPQLLGHTLINYVLKQIDATVVSVAIMVEPLIATWLAFVFLDEVPTLLAYPAGLAIIAGIYLVSTTRRDTPEVVT